MISRSKIASGKKVPDDDYEAIAPGITARTKREK